MLKRICEEEGYQTKDVKNTIKNGLTTYYKVLDNGKIHVVMQENKYKDKLRKDTYFKNMELFEKWL